MNIISLKKVPVTGAALMLMLVTVGCERKEKVLDVKTPGGGIEVEKDKKTGEVDIKIEEKR